MSDKSALASEMKGFEWAHRTFISPQSWAVVRIDGRAFHTWTRGLNKPFDMDLLAAMDATTVALCEEIQGSVVGYTQSDEISIIFTDTHSVQADLWFGGNVQKIASIAASHATYAFNTAWQKTPGTPHQKPATFDARVFTVPTLDVIRYLIWRLRDSQKNAVSMLAQAKFSHRQLHGKNTSDMMGMLGTSARELAETMARCYSGAFVTRHADPGSVTYIRRDTGQEITTDFVRRVWRPAPASLDDIRSLIPTLIPLEAK